MGDEQAKRDERGYRPAIDVVPEIACAKELRLALPAAQDRRQGRWQPRGATFTGRTNLRPAKRFPQAKIVPNRIFDYLPGCLLMFRIV